MISLSKNFRRPFQRFSAWLIVMANEVPVFFEAMSVDDVPTVTADEEVSDTRVEPSMPCEVIPVEEE